MDGRPERLDRRGDLASSGVVVGCIGAVLAWAPFAGAASGAFDSRAHARVDEPSDAPSSGAEDANSWQRLTGPMHQWWSAPARPECSDPRDGAFVDRPPGEPLEFIAELDSDGRIPSAVEIDSIRTRVHAGRASRVIEPHFGLNVVEVRVPSDDQDRNTFCSFIVASSYVPSALPVAGGLRVHVGRPVFEGPESLATGLEQALTPLELRDALEQAFGDEPLQARRCGRRPFGRCLLEATLTLEGASAGGPHRVQLTPTSDGLDVEVELVDLGVQLGLDGTLSLVNYDTSGWVRVRTAVLRARAGLEIRDGMPEVVWQRSPSVQLKGLRVDFQGLDGAMVDAFVKAFGRTLRSRMEEALSRRVEQLVERTVERQLRRFGRRDLERTIEVPPLPGGRPVTLAVSGELERLEVSPSGIELTTSVAIDGRGSIAHQGFGAPVRRREDPPPARGPLSVHLDTAVAAATLYELWKVGWLDLSLEPSELDARLPRGTRVEVSPQLPPVFDVSKDGSRVDLGRVQARASIPGAAHSLVLELDLRLQAEPKVRGDTVIVEPGPVEVFGVDVLEGAMLPQWEAALEETVRDALARRTGPLLDRAWVAMPPIEFPMPPRWPAWLHAPRALKLAVVRTELSETWLGVTGRMSLR